MRHIRKGVVVSGLREHIYDATCHDCAWQHGEDAAGNRGAGERVLRAAARHVAETGHSVAYNRIAWLMVEPDGPVSKGGTDA